MMSRGETGYKTLLNKGLVPSRPVALVDGWRQARDFLDGLIKDNQGIQNLVLDALGGFEFLCHEYIVNNKFDGIWGHGDQKGFSAFARGYHVSVPEFDKMVSRLERLHETGVGIVILGHVKTRTHTDPLQGSFDRYEADVHQKTWSVFHRWADHVLFGSFSSTTKGGVDDTSAEAERVIYTTKRDAYDAKHKGEMPDMIEIPDDPDEAFDRIFKYL